MLKKSNFDKNVNFENLYAKKATIFFKVHLRTIIYTNTCQLFGILNEIFKCIYLGFCILKLLLHLKFKSFVEHYITYK